MVKTIYISESLKDNVEIYLQKLDPTKEYGGFFLGENETLVIPKFFPNKSSRPIDSYLTPKYWKEIIDIDLKLLNLDFYIHFHTHPNHSFYSNQDLKIGHLKTFSEDSIVLLYDKNNKSYTWRCYDSSFEENYIQFVSKTYKQFKEYFAKNLGLICLKDIFLTHNGTFISTSGVTKSLIKIDNYAFTMFLYLTELSKQYYPNLPSNQKIAETVGYSPAKVKNVLDIFKKNGLFPKILK